ncbi:MAG: hypothetical protein OXG13_20390 [Gemmatimonadaceae bacterium]|nr:hypothetical protein [Gemmatimonadaceae bacterium]
MVLLYLASLVLLSCGDDRGTDPQSPWDDCALGQILTPDGDPCTYPGRNEVVSVNTEGEYCFEDNCRTADFARHRKVEDGERVLDLGLASLGDGRYAITRIGGETITVPEILERAGEAAELAVCAVGLTLKPGEGCTFNGGVFEVRDDGSGCIGDGAICAGTGIHINNFSAEKTGDTWTIISLP